MTLDHCFKKGLLRKAKNTADLVQPELDAAHHNLDEAIALKEVNHLNASVLYAYTTMFRAGRALLYKDGYTERSHACLILYLQENHVKTGKLESRFLNTLDALKSERRQTLYGTPRTYDTEELNDLLQTAEDFLKAVMKLVTL